MIDLPLDARPHQDAPTLEGKTGLTPRLYCDGAIMNTEADTPSCSQNPNSFSLLDRKTAASHVRPSARKALTRA
jgi:hypothetical protein